MDWYLTLDRLYDDGKDKQFTLSFAPFKPIRQSLFLRDKKFHAEALHELLVWWKVWIYCYLCGTLLGTLSGNSREVLSKLTVDLP